MDRDRGKTAPSGGIRNGGKPSRRDRFPPAPGPDAVGVISDVRGEFLGAWPKVDNLDEGGGGALHHITTIHYVMSESNTKCDVAPGNVPGMDSLAEVRAAIEAAYGTLTDFARAIGWKPGTVIMQFRRGSLSKELAPIIAQKLHWPLERVLKGGNNPPTAVATALQHKISPLLNEVARAEILPPALTAMTKDVPVYGTAHGGQGGDFEMNGQLIDYARRPPGIEGSKTVFCVYVQGESMVPWRRPGDLVYLNPDRPARPGDYVVVELQGKRGEPAPALLKQLVSITPKHLILAQHNPEKRDIKVERAVVKRVIRVIDWMELLGI